MTKIFVLVMPEQEFPCLLLNRLKEAGLEFVINKPNTPDFAYRVEFECHLSDVERLTEGFCWFDVEKIRREINPDFNP